jgi:replicative DNA helicase
VNHVPTSANIEHYAEIVRKKAVSRRLIHAAGQIAAKAYEEADADKALELAEQLIYEISVGTAHTDLVSLASVMDEFLLKLDRRHSTMGQVIGLPTGLAEVDEKLGGLQPEDLILLGGQPGEGKTSLLLNIVYNLLCQLHKSIAFFSLEMSKVDLATRLVSMETGIDSQYIRTRYLSDDQWNKIVFASTEVLYSDQVYVDESGDLSLAALRSKCRRHKAKHGLDLVVVDYLQLMQGDMDEKDYHNHVQVINEIARGLKLLARELQVPVIACSALNRAQNQRADPTPKLSDLREGGEYHADIVLFIRRSRERPGYSILNIAKHRNGPSDMDVLLKFNASLTKFEDADEEAA